MSQLEQLRAHRDRMHTQLENYRANHAEKSLAYDIARTARVNHMDRANAAQAELDVVSAELARAVGEGAAESVRAPLRNRSSDLRSAIDFHQAEAARIEPTLPDLERSVNSTSAGLMSPEQQYAAAHFDVLAHEWVATLEELVPQWVELESAANSAGRNITREFCGLSLNLKSPRLANHHFPDFGRGDR